MCYLLPVSPWNCAGISYHYTRSSNLKYHFWYFFINSVDFLQNFIEKNSIGLMEIDAPRGLFIPLLHTMTNFRDRSVIYKVLGQSLLNLRTVVLIYLSNIFAKKMKIISLGFLPVVNIAQTVHILLHIWFSFIFGLATYI